MATTYPNQSNSASTGPGLQAPRPLGEEIKELPRQYINVLTKPGVATFAAEMGKASWRMVWVQLLGWGVISTILGFIAQAIFTSISYRFAGSLSPEAIQALSANGASYGGIIGVPLGFFIWMGLVYLLAKAFQGQGTFLTQSYATLLFQVPLGILGSILGLFPYFGLLGLAVFIYGIVLQVFALMATHRLSGGKATAVVFLPAAVITLLIIVLVVTFISVLVGVFLTR
ncbi:MAG TPA: Yip1 family protein [Ktedonobacteraceae bacterium]